MVTGRYSAAVDTAGHKWADAFADAHVIPAPQQSAPPAQQSDGDQSAVATASSAGDAQFSTADDKGGLELELPSLSKSAEDALRREEQKLEKSQGLGGEIATNRSGADADVNKATPAEAAVVAGDENGTGQQYQSSSQPDGGGGAERAVQASRKKETKNKKERPGSPMALMAFMNFPTRSAETASLRDIAPAAQRLDIAVWRASPFGRLGGMFERTSGIRTGLGVKPTIDISDIVDGHLPPADDGAGDDGDNDSNSDSDDDEDDQFDELGLGLSHGLQPKVRYTRTHSFRMLHHAYVRRAGTHSSSLLHCVCCCVCVGLCHINRYRCRHRCCD